MVSLSALTASSLLLPAAARPASAASARAADLTAATAKAAAKALPGGIFTPSPYGEGAVDPAKLKVDLVRRVGKAFGFDLDDFADAGAMARKIQPIVDKMTPQAIAAMEKALGLDKLGVSLREMLSAMEDPGGDADKKLMGALREKAGELLKGHAAAGSGGIGLDELGRYSRDSARRAG